MTMIVKRWERVVLSVCILFIGGCLGLGGAEKGKSALNKSANGANSDGGTNPNAASDTPSTIAAGAQIVRNASSNTGTEAITLPVVTPANDAGSDTRTEPDSGIKSVVWVKVKQQANLTQAITVKDWKGRGESVRNALTTNANNSQSAIRSFLSQRGVKFRPFWIVNAIRVEADQATIDELA
jgi:hypothetical protein